MGSSRQKDRAEREFRRILVVRPGALGDTIITLPAVRHLRRAAGPGGEVEWVGYPRYLSVALNPLHASAIHSVDRVLFAGLFSEPVSRDLNRFVSSYDLVVVWCRDGIGHLCRLMDRLGVRYVQCPPFPEEGSGVHAAEHLMRSLEVIIPRCRGTRRLAYPKIVLSLEARKKGDELIRGLGLQARSFVAVHPGSGDICKNWSPVEFSRVAELARASGLGVLVIEGEADETPIRKMLEVLTPPPALLRVDDLLVIARVLSHAAAYVGNDSGISHLAAAAGTPTVAMFGPTDPRHWAPRGPSVHVLPHRARAEVVWSTIESVCRKPPKVIP